MNDALKTEQLLEQRLSIFAGSFTLEAAQAAFAQGIVDNEQLVGLLEQLVSQGKAGTQGQGDNRRYWLSEAQRQLGREKLAANGAEDAVYSILVDYYLGLAGRSLEEAFGPERALWMDRLEQELVNLRPVFEWLLKRADADRGLRLAYLLQELWFEDRHTSEARALFAELLALPAASARTSARAQYLDLAGAFALGQDDYDAARSLKAEGVAICRELDDQAALGSALIHLGHVEYYAGDSRTAQDLYQEAWKIFTALDDPVWIARAIGNLSNAVLDLGNSAEADRLVKEALQRYRDMDLEWELVVTIGTAAGVAAGLGQAERAIRLAGASAAQRERMGVSLPPVFKARFEAMITSARQALPESVQTRAWNEGWNMSLEQATEYALKNTPAFV